MASCSPSAWKLACYRLDCDHFEGMGSVCLALMWVDVRCLMAGELVHHQDAGLFCMASGRSGWALCIKLQHAEHAYDL